MLQLQQAVGGQEDEHSGVQVGLLGVQADNQVAQQALLGVAYAALHLPKGPACTQMYAGVQARGGRCAYAYAGVRAGVGGACVC